MFYPIFPGNLETPIEYEQIEKLMFTEGTPDILVTPSDLIQFVKVRNSLVSNLNRISKIAFALTLVLFSRMMSVALIAL